MAKKPANLPGVKVIDDETTPEVMAKAIVDVAESARKLLNSRLSKRAVVVLIRDGITGNSIGIRDIETVLEAAAKLDARCLKKLPTK